MILTSKKRVKKAVSEKKGTVFIYVGPTSKIISRYSVYKNGYPHHLKEAIKELPLLKRLFIHPNQLTEFEENVKKTGTVENIQFLEVKKYFSKAVGR